MKDMTRSLSPLHGAVVCACLIVATSVLGADTPRPRLAFQAYAVRELCAKDFAGTLKAAKALGYDGVETGRFFGLDAKGLKTACDEAGLELVALQLYPHDLTEPQIANTIRFCGECRCRRINVAWYKGSEENPNDWQLLVNVVNHAAEVCAKAGIIVAYHNHDHEFRMSLAGRRAIEWLYDGNGKGLTRQVNETPRFSPLVKQELDPGWCVIAGDDPIVWIKTHPNRNPTVHVMPAISNAKGLKPGEAGIGSARDKADWRRIIPALAADGTEWLVVKPTTFTDSLEDLKSSIDYLKTILGDIL